MVFHHFKNTPETNGVVHKVSNVIQNVMVSAAEAEVGSFLRRPLLTIWDKKLRRVAIKANMEKIIVLSKKQRLFYIAQQDTMIHILNLI